MADEQLVPQREQDYRATQKGQDGHEDLFPAKNHVWSCDGERPQSSQKRAGGETHPRRAAVVHGASRLSTKPGPGYIDLIIFIDGSHKPG